MRTLPIAILLLMFAGCLGPSGPTVANVTLSGSESADPGPGSIPATNTSPVPTTPSAAPEPVVDDSTGAIDGIVVDEEQVPLGGATVTLVGPLFQTVSDEAGRFTFSELEPGKESVVVTKPGYLEKGVEIEIIAEETTSILVVLIADPNSLEPYVETLTPWEGMIGCSVGLHILSSADMCTAQTQSDRSFHVGPRLAAMHWEMHWEPGVGGTARYLQHSWANAPVATVCTNGGASPVIHQCTFEKEGLEWESGADVRHWVRAIGNSTTPDPAAAQAWLDKQSGPAVQQRFTIHITLFYNNGDIPADFRNGPPE